MFVPPPKSTSLLIKASLFFNGDKMDMIPIFFEIEKETFDLMESKRKPEGKNKSVYIRMLIEKDVRR